jgi:predicted ATP-grasp superfamily ATP-dependent carboligase
VIQPLLAGEALSLSGLFAHGRGVLLSINRQHILQSGDAFAFRGCEVNSIDRSEAPFSRLLERIAAAVPELWGYAGIDLLRDGENLTVLEINPRLTTAYVGLRRALGVNCARLVMELFTTGKLPQLPPAPLKPVVVRIGDA